MKKALLLGFMSGLLLTACGGVGPEEAPVSADTLTPAQGELCEGWDSGARRCIWKCTSSATQWNSVGTGPVAPGQCQDFANAQCGRTAYSTCWSR